MESAGGPANYVSLLPGDYAPALLELDEERLDELLELDSEDEDDEDDDEELLDWGVRPG